MWVPVSLVGTRLYKRALLYYIFLSHPHKYDIHLFLWVQKWYCSDVAGNSE